MFFKAESTLSERWGPGLLDLKAEHVQSYNVCMTGNLVMPGALQQPLLDKHEDSFC